MFNFVSDLFSTLGLGALLVIALLLFLFGNLAISIMEGINGRKMVGIAETMGALWYQNYQSNAYALCRVNRFKEDLDKLIEKVEKGESKPWERMLLCVAPTFTFWCNQNDQKVAQVGNKEDFETLCRMLVVRVTGVKVNKITTPPKKYFAEAIRILVPNEPRLFVPFTSENLKKFMEQEDIYGSRRMTLEDATEHLFAHLCKCN